MPFSGANREPRAQGGIQLAREETSPATVGRGIPGSAAGPDPGTSPIFPVNSAMSPMLSVVAPMYNEEGNVEPFVRAVAKTMAEIGERYEIVLVDDGSGDATWQRICGLGLPQVRGLRLARNFGHQAAIFAGMAAATGEAVITMDGDLQHPPETIPTLVELWRQGFHVVNTHRLDAEDSSGFKKLTSRWFYSLFSALTGVPMEAGSSDFRLLDRKPLDALLSMRDADLFIRGQVAWLGFREQRVDYQAAKRLSGTTKFSLKRMVRFALGAMLSFSLVPLRLGIWAGFVTSALALAELCYIVVRYFQGGTVAGWASMMTVMSLMFAVLFVLLGIVGTYLGKIYEILKSRPRFVVAEQTSTATPGVASPRPTPTATAEGDA
jgi:dolichol-phosphate mannosyltransferase